jgi:hypothetical protein
MNLLRPKPFRIVASTGQRSRKRRPGQFPFAFYFPNRYLVTFLVHHYFFGPVFRRRLFVVEPHHGLAFRFRRSPEKDGCAFRMKLPAQKANKNTYLRQNRVAISGVCPNQTRHSPAKAQMAIVETALVRTTGIG